MSPTFTDLPLEQLMKEPPRVERAPRSVTKGPAADMDRQNQGVAERMYASELQGEESFGKQPLDPDTGDPQPRIAKRDQLAMHALIRDDDEAMLRVISREAARIGLSPGVWPMKLLEEMAKMERLYLDGGNATE